MKLGYSKINIIDTHKSRSLDFSSSSSDLPTPNSTISKTHLDQIRMKTNVTAKTAQHSYSSSPSSSSSSSSPSLSPGKKLDDGHREELERKEVEEVENDVGEITRKSADHHHRAVFGSDKYNQAAATAAMLRRNSSVTSMSAVKRAFSMRRSSSVSEGYSRIHDRLVTLASPIDDEDEQDKTRSANKKKKNRGGKILKACKRLFGL